MCTSRSHSHSHTIYTRNLTVIALLQSELLALEDLRQRERTESESVSRLLREELTAAYTKMEEMVQGARLSQSRHAHFLVHAKQDHSASGATFACVELQSEKGSISAGTISASAQGGMRGKVDAVGEVRALVGVFIDMVGSYHSLSRTHTLPSPLLSLSPLRSNFFLPPC